MGPSLPKSVLRLISAMSDLPNSPDDRGVYHLSASLRQDALGLVREWIHEHMSSPHRLGHGPQHTVEAESPCLPQPELCGCSNGWNQLHIPRKFVPHVRAHELVQLF